MKFDRPRILLEQPKSNFAAGNARWTNLDLDPIPRHLRKWGVFSFVAYWISDGFAISTWQFASGVIAVGLSWRESLIIAGIGFFFISIVIAMNGATGVIYHSPFPVIARASWGFWGSYIPIVFRLVAALFWFSINTMNGGNAMQNMIGAIWPSFLRIQNTIPEQQGITTSKMISYAVYFILQFPFLCLHPNKLRWLFIAKSTIVPVAWIAMLIWAFKSTGGGEIFEHRATLTGAEYNWAFLTCLTSAVGLYSSLSVNQADFSRYSRVSVKWQFMYVLLLPAIFTSVSFMGTAVSSAGQKKYGGAIPWDPNVLISMWDNRACRFFAGFSIVLASIGVNISANSLSAANDLAALAPQFINIRRGQLICGLLSWILMPWRILRSARVFLNFMSAYAIFMAPIAGIMLADFWIVKRRKYDCLALYQPWSIYRYSRGFNWRALVAFFAAFAPNFPGFLNSLNPAIKVGAGAYPYKFGWFLGIVGSIAVYITLSSCFPANESLIERSVEPDDIYDQNELEVSEEYGSRSDK